MEKWIHIFFSLYRDYSNSLTLSNASDLLWRWISINHIQVHTEKENFVIACLLLSQNLKLGILIWQSCTNSKEMYKKRDARAKLLFCLIKPLLFLLSRRRCILNFLLFTIHCDPSKTEYSGQMQLLLLIAFQTFFRLIGSSFVSG